VTSVILPKRNQTGMTKLIVTFRHFSNALKNSNMRRNAHLFVKSTSVKLLMTVHTAVCDTGDIL